jgi:hypothetical protein
VLAGFLLALGGALIALGSRQDWFTAHLANNESATLNVAGTHFGTAMLIFAALIIALGVARVARGYAKDTSLHGFALLILFATVATALVRTGLFLSDHHLSLVSPSSYGHLSLALGVYMLAGGVISAFLARSA